MTCLHVVLLRFHQHYYDDRSIKTLLQSGNEYNYDKGGDGAGLGSKSGQGQGPGLCIEDLQRAMQRALDALTEGLQGADRRYGMRAALCVELRPCSGIRGREQ